MEYTGPTSLQARMLAKRMELVAERFRENRDVFTPEMGFPEIVETKLYTPQQAPETWDWACEQLNAALVGRMSYHPDAGERNHYWWDWARKQLGATLMGRLFYRPDAGEHNYYWVGCKDHRVVGLIVAEPQWYKGEESLGVYFAFEPGQRHLYEEAELYASYPVTLAQEIGVGWLTYEVTDPGAWYIRGLEDQGFVPCDFDENEQPGRFVLHVRTREELYGHWERLMEEMRQNLATRET